MVPYERRKQILSILERKKYVSVEELSRELYVSLPTVRRDLSALEKEGALKRTHGGASFNVSGTYIAPFVMREKTNFQEKQIIGNIAAGLIENGDTLCISSSSTTLSLVRQINREYHIQVLTNGMTMAQYFGENNNAIVYIPGGIYNYDDDGVYGPDVINSISRRYAHYGFISCDGIDLKFGITVLRDSELHLEQAFRSSCEKLVVLADHSKFNTHFFYQSMDLADVDILITDRDPGPEWSEYCAQHDIELLY